MSIDNIDKIILQELSKDSRISLKQIAIKVNMSSPSVKERINKLKNDGIIESCTIKVNKEKLGLKINCIVTITITNGMINEFKNYIENHEKIDFCYRTAGQVCFYIFITAKEIREVEEFVDEISHYGTANTNLVFSEIQTKNSLDYALDE